MLVTWKESGENKRQGVTHGELVKVAALAVERGGDAEDALRRVQLEVRRVGGQPEGDARVVALVGVAGPDHGHLVADAGRLGHPRRHHRPLEARRVVVHVRHRHAQRPPRRSAHPRVPHLIAIHFLAEKKLGKTQKN